MELVVRHAVPGDAAAIAVIHALSWQHHGRGILPDPVLDALTEHGALAQNQATWEGRIARGGLIVADLEGRLVGFAVHSSPARGLGEIEDLHVKPGFDRNGAGSALARAAVKELQGRARVRQVQVWVPEQNRQARAFCEALGWRGAGDARVTAEQGAELGEVRYLRDLARDDLS